LLELFFARILNLKAWNHVVYIIIPFAMLGYGIGANIQILTHKHLARYKSKKILALGLALLGLLIYTSYTSIVSLPIKVDYLSNVFVKITGICMLLKAYTWFMLPFVVIGFLVVYLFTTNQQAASRLYFFDLLGSSCAAFVFVFAIDQWGVTRPLYAVILLSVFLGLAVLFWKKRKIFMVLCVLSLLFNFQFTSETEEYKIDITKGWEWVPGFYPGQYEKVGSRWHPLGRTDMFRITGEAARQDIFSHSSGTFEINIKPYPEFTYLSTNYLAGTPAYEYRSLKDAPSHYSMDLFSQPMEAPYTLLDRPQVLVIGAGGGRDIFMAKSHGATRVLGAEVNAAIVEAMSPGGILHAYTDGIYTEKGVDVYHCDGRYLVKTQPAGSFDLIVLNGVDTYNGLSSGSYAYAESYLYTKDAIKDYLKILKPDGIINFNRWLFADMPRETLKLMAITMEALEETGAQRPWKHMIIATNLTGWSLTLIKKTPFTPEEVTTVKTYFDTHDSVMFYPLDKTDPDNPIEGTSLSVFDKYASFYKRGYAKEFAHAYPYDISVITDDIPFFYKYYKLSAFNPFKELPFYYTGTIIFLTQLLSLVQAVIFILLFLFLPLIMYKKDALIKLDRRQIFPFISYFAALGIGFMFIEIPLMQKFVLLLGDPIYAISVVLAVLLCSAGLGSLSISRLKKYVGGNQKLITISTFFILVYTYIFILFDDPLNATLVTRPYALRVLATVVITFPLGFSLGIFFPSGLHLIGRRHALLIPWAWALNSGFSVLGSITAIMLAQFEGFNAILQLSIVLYFTALLSYLRMNKNFAGHP
jgi:SAM-dependent methyltransferase